MGPMWDLMQDSAIADQGERVSRLEARIKELEAELSHTCMLLRLAFERDGPAGQLLQRGPYLGSFKVSLVETSGANPSGKSRQDVIRDCTPGESLALTPLPNASSSEPDLGIGQRRTGELIGCLTPDVAGEVLADLERGFHFDAAISEVTGGGWFSRKPCEVSVVINKYGVKLNLLEVNRRTRHCTCPAGRQAFQSS